MQLQNLEIPLVPEVTCFHFDNSIKNLVSNVESSLIYPPLSHAFLERHQKQIDHILIHSDSRLLSCISGSGQELAT